jgi:DNA-binding transcriptional ArsR family regulator
MPENFFLHIRTGLQLDDPATLDPFLGWLAARRVDLVVWDVFNKLHTKNERQPEQMLPLLKRLDRIRDELGCANLVLHHARKPSPAGPDLASGGQKLRGPSEFWAWAENSLYLSPLAGKGHLRVEPESKDAQVEPFKVHLEDLPDGSRRWIFDGTVEAKLDQGARNRQAIAEALRSGAQTASTLAPLIGVSERTIKTHLAALEGDGVVRSDREPGRAGRKFWTLTDPSPAWVTDAQS